MCPERGSPGRFVRRYFRPTDSFADNDNYANLQGREGFKDGSPGYCNLFPRLQRVPFWLLSVASARPCPTLTMQPTKGKLFESPRPARLFRAPQLRRSACHVRPRPAAHIKKDRPSLGRSLVTSTALNDYGMRPRTWAMMVAARSSPVAAPARSIVPPAVPPVPVLPTVTAPPLLSEVETPPFPLSAFL
jgi:hypothetical protein